MAVRHRLIRKPPDDVWEVLSDPVRYGEWVVGPSQVTRTERQWPAVGATLHYEVKIGPATLRNRTVVRRCEPSRVLELEAHSGPLGTARIAMELRPWGEHTLIIFDEHPLRGIGGALHNGLLDAAQQLRHRAMLRRLAQVCEEDAAGPEKRRLRAP
ncbi:SRPBCC family protein [Streptomyces sp. NPDC059819]|uniref:SRPBCC family protein n=1 Tax=Streptomyces sp. NPDC059819 TaxID=3346963 RepID=UPI00364BFCE9